MSDTAIHQLLQIGTSRAGGAALSGNGVPVPLQGLLKAMPVQSDEERLWQALGALDLWQRAGHAPAMAAVPADAPCGVETLQASPQAAARMLEQLLLDVQPGLALRIEWLQLAARHGCRVPAVHLPDVLALATRHRELQAAVLPVLGERGLWLARRHPDWRWADAGADAGHAAGAGDTPALWHTGDAGQRAALLKAWRHADPGAALAALQAEWAAEPAELRAVLLPCLAVRLGLDDAPFLETALDDKRKEVRTQAQALLAALPAAPLAQRMQARIAPLFRLERHVFRPDRLHITLPEACDKAMQRDGVGTQAHPGLGEKAGWLTDMVAAVPLAHWRTVAGDPYACVKLAAATDFEHALLRGWALAVQRQGAVTPDSDETLAWLAALAQRWTQGAYPLRQQFPRDFFQLFAVLPKPRIHALLAALLESAGGKDVQAALASAAARGWLADNAPLRAIAWSQADMPLLELLERAAAGTAPDTWPAALSQAVVVRLRDGLPAMGRHTWAVKSALPVLATALDPSVADSCAHGWPEHDPTWPDWADSVTRFLNTLRFRRQLTLSFEEQPS